MKRAIYAGSFDPITEGHLDIISRSSRIAGELVVLVVENPEKKSTFTLEERMEMIRHVTSEIPNITVDSFRGLLADYVLKNDIDAVIRGLRATLDFDYELQMAHMNARLYKERADTIFLMTNPRYSFISSSLIKEVYSLGGDIEGLVPEHVLRKMREKFNDTKGARR